MLKVKEIKTITDEMYHYSPQYFTENKWIDNDTVILDRWVKKEKFTEKECSQLVKYSLMDNSMELIYEGQNNRHLVHNGKIYLVNGKELLEVDIATKSQRVIYTLEDYEKGVKQLEEVMITKDGKHISMRTGIDAIHTGNPNQPAKFTVVEVETGKVVYSFEKSFAPPFHHANHSMICPTNYKRVYFSHEGTTQYIPNRMWIYDDDKKDMWNFAKQNLDADGNVGDCFGHEIWAPDGKSMYFVKYPSSTLEPKGLMHVDVDSGKIKAVATSYDYWHVCVSPDNKYLTADTFEPDKSDKTKSEVVVVDLADGKETVVEIARQGYTHPAHPHPQFSPNSDKIIYTHIDENGVVMTKIAYLEK